MAYGFTGPNFPNFAKIIAFVYDAIKMNTDFDTSGAYTIGKKLHLENLFPDGRVKIHIFILWMMPKNWALWLTTPGTSSLDQRRKK